MGAADTSPDAVLRDPYRVWLSEVMLQQTQVATVIPYFERFLHAFPTVRDLAQADAEQVMGLWSGLGYYSRARNLHAAARQVTAAGGEFPSSPEALAALPGVGRSTAAAIATFGFGERAAILDGNVKRVLGRVFALEGDPTSAPVLRQLWVHAERELPEPGSPAADLIAYTQGLMDLGAMVCTRTKPSCNTCPLAAVCQACATGEPERFPGKKARKTVPVRTVHLLQLQSERGVLLEARPDTGLWGGLWSLPELPEAPELSWSQVGSFEHVFTHFRMLAQVWSPPTGADLKGLIPEKGRQRWVKPEALKGAPLPAPIRKYLEGGKPASPQGDLFSG